MNRLFEAQKILLTAFQQTSLYPRAWFKSISFDNHITGIVGSRGIGKTTLLLHHALRQGALSGKALYASLDHLFFLDHSLVELVDQLYKETDIRVLCADEIHKHENWTQALKNIADTYPDFRVLFSGSSVIDLVHGKYDLSRRVTLHQVHGFSFREYLEFYLKVQLPILPYDRLTKDHLSFAQALDVPQILKHFKEYLRIGYYPFFKQLRHDAEKFQAIEHVVQKTIYEDIAIFKALKTPTLFLIEKLYKYILNSTPGELNASKLSQTLGKDFEMITECLSLLERASLIRFLWPKKAGSAYMRNPTKMYPENTNLIYASYLPLAEDQLLGKVRETFVMSMLQNAGITPYYTEAGDFQVQEVVFEVGGRNKTREASRQKPNTWILADGHLVGGPQIIPLYLLGFLT